MKWQSNEHLVHTSPSIAIKKLLKLNRCQDMTQVDRCQEGVSQVKLSCRMCQCYILMEYKKFSILLIKKKIEFVCYSKKKKF